ncbi:MAG TPA: hypothetical protein VLB46_07720 [Pyrinomonadaceae bacterium]|nr:hypothetical protein [Pyrinomonadaceae bacterium]
MQKPLLEQATTESKGGLTSLPSQFVKSRGQQLNSSRKKTSTKKSAQNSSLPVSEPEHLVKSGAEKNDAQRDEDQGTSKENTPDPLQDIKRGIEWLRKRERYWFRWTPVVLSAVTVAVTIVYGLYAKRQWDATVEQNRLMERALNISERAYVAIEGIRMDLDKGEITITVHNVGKSPAGDLTIEANAAVFGSTAQPETSGVFKSDWGHTSLYPASLKTIIVVSLQPYTPAIAERIRTGAVKLFVTIRVDYSDGFESAPAQHFFYRYVPPPYDFWLNAPINTFEELQKIK